MNRSQELLHILVERSSVADTVSFGGAVTSRANANHSATKNIC